MIDVDMSESQAGKVIERAVVGFLSEVPTTKQSKGEGGKEKIWMAIWPFEVADVEGQEEFAGQKLIRMTPLQGKGVDFTERLLIGLGLQQSDENCEGRDDIYQASGDGPTRRIRFDEAQLVGKRGMLHCEAETWEGIPRTKITKVTPIPTEG